MKRFTTYIICILIILLFVGCRTRIQYIPVKSTEIKTVHFRDTTIKKVLIPYRDSVNTPDTSSYLRNPYAESWAVWSGGQLRHSLNILPDTLPITLQIEAIEITRTVEIPIEVERKLSRWEKVKMDVGGWAMGVLSGVLALGIGYAVWWLIKRRK